jgi:hypothetical protein
MVRLPKRGSSPPVRVIVPRRELSKAMVSPLAVAAMRSRRGPAPLSSKLVTVSVLGTVRSSRASRAGRPG